MGDPTDKPLAGRSLPPKTTFEIHRQMVISLYFATSALCLTLALGFYLSNITALVAVAAAGALGGFVSSLRRLYSFQSVFPVDFFEGEHKVDVYLIIYSLIPSLVGAIAAVLLYLIFAAGLIKFDMFPHFDLSNLNPQKDGFMEFVDNWHPALPVDYAKTLVWGFIAGFSERFVPNLLDRLTSQGKGQEIDANTTNDANI